MGVAVQKKSQYLLTLDKSVPYHALWQLKREHPHLELKLFAGLSSDFAYRVEHGELDAAIVTESPRPLAASLVWTPLYSEPMVLIVNLLWFTQANLTSQPARRIRMDVVRPRAGDVLCVAHVRIKGVAGCRPLRCGRG